MEKKKIKPANYWTKEKCIEDAKKYKSKSEWQKNSGSAYESARKNKWLDECCEHMVNGNIKWTKEKCIKDAKKYNSKSEWQKNSGSAYGSAIKNKWLDECCQHMESGFKWTKEKCIEDAKKYKSRTEWQKNSSGAYQSARKNKWLDECCEHMVCKHMVCKLKWTKEKCIKDAKKYKSRNEWKKNSGSAYGSAMKNKWLDECCEHMIFLGNRRKRMVYCYVFSDKSCYVGLTYNEEKRKYQHLNSIKGKSPVFKYMKKTNLIPKYIKISDYVLDIEAQKIESDTINEYKKNGYNVLNSRKAGALGGNFSKWTKEKCIEDAKKYKSRKEWEKSSGGYECARKNKWLDECCEHMVHGNIKWTKEKCIKDARKYKSRNEWSKNSRSAYQSAWGNGWLDECFPPKELIESLEMV